jgi:glycosyltransferase involved in cell wall biosynthesis
VQNESKSRIALFFHGPLLGGTCRAELGRRLLRALEGAGVLVEAREFWRGAELTGGVAAREPHSEETATEETGLGRTLQLSDGAGSFEVHSTLTDAELAELRRWSQNRVPEGAALLVLADEGEEQLAARASLDVPESGALLAITLEDAVRFADAPESLGMRIREFGPLMSAEALDAAQAGAPDAELDGAPDRQQARSNTALRIAHDTDTASRWLAELLSSALPETKLSVLGNRDADIQSCDLYVQLGAQSSQLRLALFAGKACIATMHEANAALLPHHGLGWPIGLHGAGEDAVPDIDGLVLALRQACTDRQAARNRGERGRQHALRVASHAEPWPLASSQLDLAPMAKLEASARRSSVRLEAPIFASNSYGRIARETARQYVEDPLLDVGLSPIGRPERSLDTDADLLPLLKPSWDEADVCIRSGWPFRHDRPRARRWVQRFDWEYGAPPREIAARLANGPDEIWVHSEHVREGLRAAGVPEALIRVMPHGFDPELFAPGREALPELAARIGERHAFLFAGAAIPRKGIDALLAAWLQAFRRDEPVCLVCKVSAGTSDYGGQQQIELLQRIAGHPEAPELILLDADLSDDDMGRLFATVDTLVHPYRGEGFGMPVLEARGAGLPVIVTAGGAPTEFLLETGTLAVAAERVPAKIPEATLGNAWLLDPDPDELAQGLRMAWQHADALRAEAQRDTAHYRQEHSWARRCADQTRRLHELSEGAQAARARRASEALAAGASKTLL